MLVWPFWRSSNTKRTFTGGFRREEKVEILIIIIIIIVILVGSFIFLGFLASALTPLFDLFNVVARPRLTKEAKEKARKLLESGEKSSLEKIDSALKSLDTIPPDSEVFDLKRRLRHLKNDLYGDADSRQKEADFELFIVMLKEGKVNSLIEGASTSVIMRSNETLQEVLPHVAFLEARSVTNSQGIYGEPSFRIAKGVYWRMGGFKSQSQSHDELKAIDEGILTLTDKRIIFSGAKYNREINLAKLIAVDPIWDGISIESSGSTKTQYFVGISQQNPMVEFNIEGRSRSVPLSNEIFMYMVQGAIKKLENRVIGFTENAGKRIFNTSQLQIESEGNTSTNIRESGEGRFFGNNRHYLRSTR